MTTTIMGRTFDHAIISIFRSIEPDSIGRSVETVRGGGNVIFLGPPPEILGNVPGEFHREFILTYPYTEKDIVPLFVKRLLKKFMQHDIAEVRVNGKLVKRAQAPKSVKRRRKIELPKDAEFPVEIYKKAVTQDQVEALKALEFLLPRKPKEKRAVVVIANRGRGKSAALGLALAAIAHKYAGKGYLGRFFIPITAPSR
jgi:tRNA(Met) cytidine acetyltransferase